MWLALAAGLIAYWFSKWLIDYENPYRYEYIEAAIVLLYSWPAGLGVIVAGVTPKTALSTYKRIGGIVARALYRDCSGLRLSPSQVQVK